MNLFTTHRPHLIWLTLICIVFVTYSCKEKPEDKHFAIIQGKFTSANNKELILQEIDGTKIYEVSRAFTDTDGFFEIKLKEAERNFYRLKINENNIIHLFLNENDSIKIKGEYPFLPRTYTIKGSKDCYLLNEMNKELIKSTDILNNLRDVYREYIRKPNVNEDSLRVELRNVSDSLYLHDRDYLRSFIKDNPTSPAIYAALFQYVLTNPILRMEKDIDIFEYALEMLQKHNPDLTQTRILASDVSKYNMQQSQINRLSSTLQVGSEAPDFILPDINNQELNLYNFKGDYILLYFWASWSSESIDEVLKVKQLKNSADIDNLTLILVSLDQSRTNWEAAVKNLNLKSYVNLCDMRVWESPVSRVYGFSSIPMNFFIDPSGKIIGINMNTKDILSKLNNMHS